jgi:hypothetical protein
MQYLSGVFFFKIGYTIVLCFGLLLVPTSFLKKAGFPTFPSAVFLRLLGVAYGALLVGYVLGLVQTLHGVYPRDTVWVGIVSNGGTFFLLSIDAFRGAWAAWGSLPRMALWVSLVITGLITAGLIVFGPCGYA